MFAGAVAARLQECRLITEVAQLAGFWPTQEQGGSTEQSAVLQQHLPDGAWILHLRLQAQFLVG